MNGLFFGGGAAGGLGVMILLAVTSTAVIRYFTRHRGTESTWARAIAPALSGLLLSAAIVLAIAHFGTLLGTGPHNPAAWLLPAAFGIAAVAGLGWGVFLRARRPHVYATIGLGAHATSQTAPTSARTLP